MNKNILWFAIVIATTICFIGLHSPFDAQGLNSRTNEWVIPLFFILPVAVLSRFAIQEVEENTHVSKTKRIVSAIVLIIIETIIMLLALGSTCSGEWGCLGVIVEAPGLSLIYVVIISLLHPLFKKIYVWINNRKKQVTNIVWVLCGLITIIGIIAIVDGQSCGVTYNTAEFTGRQNEYCIGNRPGAQPQDCESTKLPVYCYQALAWANRNIPEQAIQACMFIQKEWERDNCIRDIAQERIDPVLCNSISNAEIRLQCITTNQYKLKNRNCNELLLQDQDRCKKYQEMYT